MFSLHMGRMFWLYDILLLLSRRVQICSEVVYRKCDGLVWREKEHLTSVFRSSKQISVLACKYTYIVICLVLDFCFSFGGLGFFGLFCWFFFSFASLVCLEISNSAAVAAAQTSVTQSWFCKTRFGVFFGMNCSRAEVCTDTYGCSQLRTGVRSAQSTHQRGSGA